MFSCSVRDSSQYPIQKWGLKKKKYLMQFLKDTKQSNLTRKGFLHQLGKHSFLGQLVCSWGLLIFQLSSPGNVTTVFDNYQKECRNSHSMCFPALAYIRAFWKTQVHGALNSYCSTEDREEETMVFFPLCIPFAIYLQFHLLYSAFGYSLCSVPFISFFYVGSTF